MSKDFDKIPRHELLMMKKIDGEISPEEAKELQQYLEAHPDHIDELDNFKKLKEETGEMRKQILPEIAWDAYWANLYNRMERGISWILISVGAIIVAGFGLYEMINSLLGDTDMPVFLKFGILALMLGGIILLISVVREKLMNRKHDKYKEIQR